MDEAKNIRSRLDKILSIARNHTGTIASEISTQAAQAIVSLDQLIADRDALALALKDVQYAHSISPSCQIGIADRCRCIKCANERAKAALSKGGNSTLKITG
jgi:hypothetical protein